jgi:regulator of protease activity HflC (stomatin/prohibitin superfamily)
MAEKPTKVLSGYLMLVVGIVLLAVLVGVIFYSVSSHTQSYRALDVILLLAALFILRGLFIVNPNEAKVVTLFGNYAGTVRKNGFCWANPFFVKRRFSLRARNLNGQKLKVNDKVGNPIEIAVVLVWQVQDTFKAAF